MKQLLLWISALVLGLGIGLLQNNAIDAVADVVASVFTRLFQLLAVPTVVLAVVNTLASMGSGSSSGRLFRRTMSYTLVTTVAAAAVGALLYVIISPAVSTSDGIASADATSAAAGSGAEGGTWTEYLLDVVPSNVVRPLLEGNVLSLLLLAFAVGTGLAKLPPSANKKVVVRCLTGLQELLFLLIRWLIAVLPLGIVAFSAQLVHLVVSTSSEGVGGEALGRYALVVLGGNVLQFFVVLPLLLLLKGINPWRALCRMSPAILMALFTKSSAATLPVTMDCAERRLGVRGSTARFVLPICTTINMNGCAAFILITSLFVMQLASGAEPLTAGTILLWLLIAVVTAIGNAGVPMGCYFITFSLMQGIGAPVAVMGLILPIYTVIDMIETAENVWSDSCVCVVVDKGV
jgi:Na+/H+-dicarboxylate symporter